MRTLVLLRHGESVWNSEGLFTGWVDVGLSGKGSKEAEAGRARCCATQDCVPASCTPRC